MPASRAPLALLLLLARPGRGQDNATSAAATPAPLFHPQVAHQPVNRTVCAGHGVLLNNKCDCFYPYTGHRCMDFACEHGLSVGPRYDPTSAFFNKKCICDEDWSGELCHVPIANQCNERGQYVNGRCICHGYYFGPRCQCVCNYGYEGDYCDQIVCHHGYPDKANNSNSCVCPPRHSGLFCDECAIQDPHQLPFPNCTIERVPLKAKLSRIRTNKLLFKRIIILLLAFGLLLVLVAAMVVLHWGNRRNAKFEDGMEMRNNIIVSGRQAMLQQMFLDKRRPSAGRYLDPDRLDHPFL